MGTLQPSRRVGAVVAVLRHQTVPSQAVKSGVDLPNIQRPGGSGPLLKLSAELIAAAGFVLQKSQ